uniref:Uncharacterized protein n=1 Tax=Glossina brevipalpis TaxID=37001 RepID=A0A1A9WME8_9MUSC
MASSNHRGGGGGGVGGGGGGGGAAGSGLQVGSAWFQRKINLRPQHRGVHLVTEEILRQMPELGQFSVGLCHVQIASASITAFMQLVITIANHWGKSLLDKPSHAEHFCIDIILEIRHYLPYCEHLSQLVEEILVHR